MSPTLNDPHYVIEVETAPPTRLVCRCGVEYRGDQCLAFMVEHVHVLNAEAEVEP